MVTSAPQVLGWRIRRPRPMGLGYEYATGSRTWARERRRAFLFTTFGRGRGLDDGLRWAFEHLWSLRKTREAGDETRVVRVTVKRARKGAAA